MGQSLGILSKIFHGLLQSSRQIPHTKSRLLHSHSSINPDIQIYIFYGRNSVFKTNRKFISCVCWRGGWQFFVGV